MNEEKALQALRELAAARAAMSDHYARRAVAEAELKRISDEFLALHNAQQRADDRLTAIMDGKPDAGA